MAHRVRIAQEKMVSLQSYVKLPVSIHVFLSCSMLLLTKFSGRIDTAQAHEFSCCNNSVCSWAYHLNHVKIQYTTDKKKHHFPQSKTSMCQYIFVIFRHTPLILDDHHPYWLWLVYPSEKSESQLG